MKNYKTSIGCGLVVIMLLAGQETSVAAETSLTDASINAINGFFIEDNTLFIKWRSRALDIEKANVEINGIAVPDCDVYSSDRSTELVCEISVQDLRNYRVRGSGRKLISVRKSLKFGIEWVNSNTSQTSAVKCLFYDDSNTLHSVDDELGAITLVGFNGAPVSNNNFTISCIPPKRFNLGGGSSSDIDLPLKFSVWKDSP